MVTTVYDTRHINALYKGLLTDGTHSRFVTSVTNSGKILGNILISQRKCSSMCIAGLRKTIKILMAAK
jgi:hypothetical protein